MKRLFRDRARLTIYLEARQLQAITEVARAQGTVVMELMRELINEHFNQHCEAPGPVQAPAMAGSEPTDRGKRWCAHGIAMGGRCFRCPEGMAQ